MALSDSPSLFIPKKKQQFVLRTFSSPDIARAQTKYFPDSSFLFLFIFLLSFIRLTFSEKITHTCGGIIKDDYLTGVWILSAFHATFIKIHAFYSRLISTNHSLHPRFKEVEAIIPLDNWYSSHHHNLRRSCPADTRETTRNAPNCGHFVFQ